MATKTKEEPEAPKETNVENAASTEQRPFAFNQKQLARAAAMSQKKKVTRQQAKDEERLYVEYKKQVILSKVQPKVGAMKSSEDNFPKRPKGLMQFGERKAHYLNIRPSSKYATWIGRKKGTITAKARIVAPINVTLTDHSTVKTSSSKTSSSKANRSPMIKKAAKQVNDANKSANNKSDQNKDNADGAQSEIEPMTAADDNEFSGAEEEENVQKGRNADDPLVKGVPFWTVPNPSEQDELTDDDMPVDMEILEKVVAGTAKLTMRPFFKRQFNPFGSVLRFKYDDVLFVRDKTLFASTVEAVIALQPDDDAAVVPPKIEKKIKFHPQIKTIVFDPSDRAAGNSAPVVSELKDIKRVAGEK